MNWLYENWGIVFSGLGTGIIVWVLSNVAHRSTGVTSKISNFISSEGQNSKIEVKNVNSPKL